MKRILRHPLIQKHGEKFLRFAVCGGLGAVIDFGTLHLLVANAGWEEKYALAVSTGLALIFVFLANRFFTFRATGKGAARQMARFFLVYLIAAGLNYSISLGFVVVGVHYLVAKALAVGCMMFVNYFFLNSFVFKAPRFQEEGLAA